MKSNKKKVINGNVTFEGRWAISFPSLVNEFTKGMQSLVSSGQSGGQRASAEEPGPGTTSREERRPTRSPRRRPGPGEGSAAAHGRSGRPWAGYPPGLGDGVREVAETRQRRMWGRERDTEESKM